MSIPAQAFPKPVRKRDREYLRHIRRQGCLICHRYAQAHHVTYGGIGTKGSDYETVPLCWKHHAQLHAGGQDRFELKHGLHLRLEAEQFRMRYEAVLSVKCGELNVLREGLEGS